MSIIIDLSGPEGNVFHLCGIASNWNAQLVDAGAPSLLPKYRNRKNVGGLIQATENRLKAEGRKLPGDYNDVLDTLDSLFSGVIGYEFENDPRKES